MKPFTQMLVAVSALLFAFSAGAGQSTLFGKYENVRQALLKDSLTDIQRTAKDLAEAARTEKQPSIAERAEALSGVAGLKAARDSFAMLSEQMIRFRDGASGDRPIVIYCPMHKASWLQPKGAVTNPYADDASMRSCGQVRNDAATAPPAHQHHH